MSMFSIGDYWDDTAPCVDQTVRERTLGRLVGVAVALDHALADLETEAANPLLYLEPDLRALVRATDVLIKRLAE